MTEQPHGAASVIAFVAVPGVMMLLTSLISAHMPKPAFAHLIVVLVVGITWQGMARRWLTRYSAKADARLLRNCLATLFLYMPGAYALVAFVCIVGGTGFSLLPMILAYVLGSVPLWSFYYTEIRASA